MLYEVLFQNTMDATVRKTLKAWTKMKMDVEQAHIWM